MYYLKIIKGGKKNLNQYWSYSWKRVSEVNYKTDLYSTRTKSFWKEQFGFRDETGIKSTETRWVTVGFMRHTCTLNISHLNKYYKFIILI